MIAKEPLLSKAHDEVRPLLRPPHWLRVTCFFSAGILPVCAILFIAVIVISAAPKAGGFDLFTGGLAVLFWCFTIGAILWNSYSACFRGSGKAAWIVVVVSVILASMSVAFVQHDLGMWAWQMSVAGSLFAYYLITVCLLHARLAYLNQRMGSLSCKPNRGPAIGARA